MKEPWEVYFESVERGVRGRPMPEPPVDSESDEAGAFRTAIKTAQVSTADFLIRDPHWLRSAAAHLVHEFFKTSLDWLNNGQVLGFAGLKIRLRHCYEDWLLQLGGPGALAMPFHGGVERISERKTNEEPR